MVNMEPAPEGAGRRWNVTNLDGSFHKHVKYGGAGQQTVTSHEEQQQQRMTGDTSSPGRETREQAIERMHNENIKAIENLTKAINNLAEKWTGTAS